MNEVYKGSSFIVCLTIVTLIMNATFGAQYCRSSSGDSVDLLSRTYTTVVLSDWCITNLAHGWRVSIQSSVGIANLIPQRFDVVAIGCYVVRFLSVTRSKQNPV